MIESQRLDDYAENIIRTGVNVQPGQTLIVQFNSHCIDMLNRVTKFAYIYGANLVVPVYFDEKMNSQRLAYANEIDIGNSYVIEPAIANALNNGAARLCLISEYIDVYSDIPALHMQIFQKANGVAMGGIYKAITSNLTNWCIAACANEQWGELVFPGLKGEAAKDALWNEILSACRITGDPLSNWEKHNLILKKRMSALNRYKFDYLHFKEENTDLKVHLAKDHVWRGGNKVTASGIPCISNFPTEEVFTTPHSQRVTGRAVSTKPLVYCGYVHNHIVATFDKGAIVKLVVDGKNHGTLLHTLINEVDGASRLGEVALVPASSPIKKLFYSTLFDENSASHIAIGQSYKQCMADNLSPEEIKERGGNFSSTHIDWMIGSKHMTVIGYAEGVIRPIMVNGEFTTEFRC